MNRSSETLRMRTALLGGMLLLTLGVTAAHGQAPNKKVAVTGGGDSGLQATATACLMTVNGHSGLKVGVTWSGDRVSGGRYAVETNRAGAYGVNWEQRWSLPRAERSGTNSYVFELFHNGVNEQAQAVTFELSSGGKVVWTTTVRTWDIKPCL